MKSIIITGWAGFIGGNFIKYFLQNSKNTKIINVDNLTPASNIDFLKDIKNNPNYFFEKVDITDYSSLKKIFEKYSPDAIIHFAAETHVDFSISNPNIFLQTNIIGTANLLNLCREFWDLENNFSINRKNIFYQISTDEVFGHLGENGKFSENSPYNPRSPYSASKASADFLVKSYGNTYNLPFLISHCSNNFGPGQFGKKFIPVCVEKILKSEKIPIYWNWENIRDWIFVEDHCKAIFEIFHNSEIGETYNIGWQNEISNISLVKKIIQIIDQKLWNPPGFSINLISFVDDRLGHDFRYAVDISKIRTNLDWEPIFDLQKWLEITIDWYLDNFKKI